MKIGIKTSHRINYMTYLITSLALQKNEVSKITIFTVTHKYRIRYVGIAIPRSRTVFQSRNPGIMRDQIPGLENNAFTGATYDDACHVSFKVTVSSTLIVTN